MNNINRFDEAAPQWDSNPIRVELARALGTAIIRAVAFQPHWHVLDYGAGTGLLTLNLLPHCSSILAMDSSVGMLEALSKKLSDAGIRNVQTRQWDLEKEPFLEAGSEFDLVVSSMTFHHVRDVPLVLKRLAENLKPGGCLAVADLDVEDGSFHGNASDVFHHGFNRSQISDWLASTGLSQISIQDTYKITKPDASGQSRNYGVFLCTARKG